MKDLIQSITITRQESQSGDPERSGYHVHYVWLYGKTGSPGTFFRSLEEVSEYLARMPEEGS